MYGHRALEPDGPQPLSTPELLLQALRAEMRRAGLTYRALAGRVGMSESSIKRVFSQADMSLSRMSQFCQAAGVSMHEVLQQALQAAPESDRLTLEQERSLVADPVLLLVAVCCLGQWSFEQILDTYRVEAAPCTAALVRLDRLGLIELKPLNRYRLRVSRAFRWRPDGPVQAYFREHVVQDYFGGRFDGPGETLMAIHARLSSASAQEVSQHVERLAAELSRLHQEDARLPVAARDGYTLVVGLRSWELAAFTGLRRDHSAEPGTHQKGPRKT
jgi:transcriptional regulator with XRE-family HTH domain